jgi:hypothetical protein
MNTIGIFTGKQKEYNERLLTLLYDNGPLTAWELTGKIRKTGKQSLHATLNKRLRNLEKKSYVTRSEKKWFLGFKGFLAVILIQPEPKIWNPIWTDLFQRSIKTIEEQSEQLLGVEKSQVQAAFKGFKSLGLFFDDFDAWINISRKVKELMKSGVINFDIIKDETLLAIILMETTPLKELSDAFKASEN